jgi:hypothetical protein
MNDIERYNFWQLELDDFVKKQKEDKGVVEFPQRIGKPFDGLGSTVELDKLFCEAIKRKGA